MCNVYSFSGFAKILIKNKITFSIRDFLDDKKVDELIQKLVDATCGDYSYVGAGIERACFADYYSNCAIKVDKDFYVNYEDECARDDYEDNLWYEHDGDSDEYWEDGAWAFNHLDTITHYKSYCCDQNAAEINIYQKLMSEKSELLDYMPRLYAVSTNKCVEILEYCGYCDILPSSKDRERYNKICSHFDDTHCGNFGINTAGKLVILDIGFGSL